MAKIKEYLDKIMSARFGEHVRGAIHDSLKAMNDQINEDLGGMIGNGNNTIINMNDLIESIENMKANGDLLMKPEFLTDEQWEFLKTKISCYYKKFENTYKTAVENEQTISIGIDSYNDFSILNVYVEGRILNANEYEIDSTNKTITLKVPLSEIGTEVLFVMFQSIALAEKDFKNFITENVLTEEVKQKVAELIRDSVATSIMEEIEQMKKDATYQKANITIAAEVEAETDFEIPLQYIVGGKTLIVHWEGCMLEEGQNGNYIEIGEAGMVSNIIQFGWKLEIGDKLIIEVRGDINE